MYSRKGFIMSSINGIGASSSMLQQLQSSGRPSGPPPGPPPGHTEAIESLAAESGLDSSEISDLMAKLNETAESVKQSGEGPEEMKQALDSVLEDAGIDTDALHEKLSNLTGGRPPARGPGGFGAAELSTAELDGNSIFEMLQNLPIGSLIDSDA